MFCRHSQTTDDDGDYEELSLAIRRHHHRHRHRMVGINTTDDDNMCRLYSREEEEQIGVVKVESKTRSGGTCGEFLFPTAIHARPAVHPASQSVSQASASQATRQTNIKACLTISPHTRVTTR